MAIVSALRTELAGCCAPGSTLPWATLADVTAPAQSAAAAAIDARTRSFAKCWGNVGCRMRPIRLLMFFGVRRGDRR
jgi:hypothetical protein